MKLGQVLSIRPDVISPPVSLHGERPYAHIHKVAHAHAHAHKYAMPNAHVYACQVMAELKSLQDNVQMYPTEEAYEVICRYRKGVVW